MTDSVKAYLAPAIFDGERILEGYALLVDSQRFAAILPVSDIPADVVSEEFENGILAPGYVDIQVNGGGGIMFNDNQSVETLATMAAAHASLGATSILPTLITDTAERVSAAINAVEHAIVQGIPGIIGLHLEGPHLSPKRKGAHAEPFIRTMTDVDLELLRQAAQKLPVLMLTISPENVSTEQMLALNAAGVILSLGHTTADYSDCVTAVDNGATCVTHLFNAMSQLGNRDPGVVGAAISLGSLSAGLIADTYHVHPETIGTAIRAKRGPGQLFLISDAMAAAGSTIEHFILNDRRIERHGGRLTLEDGTLAGADLDLSTAVRNMTNIVGTTLQTSLAMATSIPASIVGREQEMGHINRGQSADFILLDDRLQLARVWQKGALIVS